MMGFNLMKNVLPLNTKYAVIIRGFKSGNVLSAGARWREEKGEERHANAARIFADVADWSYLDGRPGSLNTSQIKRYNLQAGYNRTIQTMLGDVDQAKKAEEERLATRDTTKRETIANKLNAKGAVEYYARNAANREKRRVEKYTKKAPIVLKGEIVV